MPITQIVLLLKSKLGLFLLTLVCLLMSAVFYVNSLNSLVRTEENRQAALSLARELRQTSDDLTRMVRTYVTTGNPLYKRHFQEILDIRDGKAPRPEGLGNVYWDLVGEDDHRPRPSGPPDSLLDLMHKAGILEKEFAVLSQSKTASDNLTEIEFAAMALIESDDSPEARLRASSMLFDTTYLQFKANIMEGVATFQNLVEQRTQHKLAEARTAKRHAIVLLSASSALTVFLFAILLSGWKSERRVYQLGQSLRESEERFRLMANEIKDYAIIFLDPEGRISSWNPGAEQIKGYTKGEIIGKSLDVFYTPEDVSAGKPRTLLDQAKAEGRRPGTR